MATPLRGKTIAILVTDGFEQVEMTKPREVLDAQGARALIVSPKHDTVEGWNHHAPAERFPVDVPLDRADPAAFDALLLPGGVMNPDQLRTDEKVVRFVRAFVRSGKPIAAICHGPWTLIEADGVRGRTMTSWPSLRTDLVNAGAKWVDRDVVIDGPLVTSRKPDDIPAFARAATDLFARPPARTPASAAHPR